MSTLRVDTITDRVGTNGPASTTQSVGNNTTKVATTAFTVAEIGSRCGTPTTNGKSLISAANYVAMRTLLSLGGAALLEVGTAASTVCAGDDSRLSDARTPTAHASSHASGESDAVKLDDLSAPDDNTDLDATTLVHGLLAKLDKAKLDGIATEATKTELFIGVGSRDISIASGTQAITGIGFQPRVIVVCTNINGASQVSIGIDNATTRYCVYHLGGGTWGILDKSMRAYSVSNYYDGYISTFGVDGFTITWEKTGSPTGTLSFVYLAIK